MELTIIRFINLPCKINGVTTIDENGDYNIYINQNLCPCKIEKAIQHEIRHIKNYDFSKNGICDIEINAKLPLEMNLDEILI